MSTFESKKQIVTDLQEKFAAAQGVVVVDYTGVNAKQTTELRKAMRENNVDYIVAKNTLFLRAAKEAGYTGMEEMFTGVSAVAFSAEDAVKPANIISKFIKDNKIMVAKGGILEGEIIDAAKVEVLGSLPSKEELLSKVASCFKGPLQNVCYALDAVRKKAEEENASA
ncbi:50S ribosomal protein L10 [Peptococcus simiae]|uniref:Large ribosomal subunit protein uL10 n=1 Tax=Peptococcus simiae TaxID=1643805 RepID=A0ABW9GW36_9FIRM